MSRIFLSHSSKDNREAVALKQWLVDQDPPLAKEIFLDLDGSAGIPPGTKWKDALRLASHRAEAVICLLSATWEASTECTAEFRTAENLGKRIFPARLEPQTGAGATRDWQYVDLFAAESDTPMTEIDITSDESVALPTEGLLRLRDQIVGNRVGPDSFVWPPGAPGSDKYADRAPYRGWEPLEDVDAGVFYGRDAELLKGLDELRRIRGVGGAQLFVILAASGAGKSSFLRAGLLPRLRRDDRTFVPLEVVRPERNVLTGENGLAKSIRTTRERFGLTEPDLGAIKADCLKDTERVYELLREVRQAATMRLGGDGSPPTLVLPVDQGEELFGAGAGPEAGRFLEIIAELATPAIQGESDTPVAALHDLSLIVAITIRTDRHDELQDAPQLAGVPTVTFADLKAMPPHQFREVILGPAQRATEGGRKLEVEPALVDRLVADCTAGADTLPLLALTLSRLFQDYGGDGDLRLDEYELMGGIPNVVETEIDQLLSRDEQERCQQLKLLRKAFIPWLVTVDADDDQPVRRVANWDELPQEARPLLNDFVTRRLLVQRSPDGTDKRGGGGVVEVALESLLRQWDELKKWLDQERGDLKQAAALERSAREWAEQGQKENWLLEGDRITAAEKLLQRPDFEKRLAAAQEYVRQSRAREELREAERRRQRAMRRKFRILTAASLLLVICIVAVIAIYQHRQASIQQQQADRELRNNAGLKMMSTAEQMLNGGRTGGDVLALQLVLAANEFKAPPAELLSLVNSRRDLIKIMETPSSSPVRSMTASPDGRLIASAGDGAQVRMWEAASGKPGVALTVGGQSAPRIAFGSDGSRNLLATGNDLGVVQVWNTEKGSPLGSAVNLVRADADGRAVQTVIGIAISPDGNRIAAQTNDLAVYAWDRSDGGVTPKQLSQPVRDRRVQDESTIAPLAFSPDSRFIAFADGADARMVDVESGATTHSATPGQTPPTTKPPVTSIAFSPAGDRLAVGRHDGTIEFLDGRTLASSTTFNQSPDNQPIKSLAFSPRDGAWLISGSENSTMQMWDTRSHQPIGQPLAGHHGAVTSVQFLPMPEQQDSADPQTDQSVRIVSGSTDGSIRVWNASVAVPFATGQGHVLSVAYGPDGTVAAGCEDGSISLWNPKGAALIRRLADPKTASPSAAPVADTGCPAPKSTQPAKAAITSLAFQPGDSSRIVSGSSDGSVKLWNVMGNEVETLDDHLPADGRRPRVMSVAFSPDGGQVISGGYASDRRFGLVRLWDVRSRQVIDVHETAYPVWNLAVSPDGRAGTTFVTGSGSTQCDCVQRWNANAGKLEQVGEPMKGRALQTVYAVRFSPDGKYVVSGHSDGEIRLWGVGAGDDQQPKIMNGDQNAVVSLAFSNDEQGERIVSGDSVGKVRIWDTKEQQPVGAPFTGNPAWLTSVAFSPDNQEIVSASYDGNLHLWPAPKDLHRVVCGMLSSSMNEESWEDHVSKLYPKAKYHDLCP